LQKEINIFHACTATDQKDKPKEAPLIPMDLCYLPTQIRQSRIWPLLYSAAAWLYFWTAY